MLRSRTSLLLSFLIALAAGCAKDEFAIPEGGAAAPSGSAQAAPPRQDAPPPEFAANSQVVVRLLDNQVPDAAPVLEVRAWTRDGRAVPGHEYRVYWQTDEGPSLSAEKLGPEGWAAGPYPSGALIHRVYFHPTGLTAPLMAPVGQYMQPGRIVRVDALIVPAGIVSGVVLDENGLPVPGATLAGFQQPLLQVDESERPSADNVGTADENGLFRLGGFAAGQFVLEAGSPGRVTVWRLAGVLAEGQEVEGVELQLEPAHTVYGQVLNDAGEAVSGARIVAGKAGRRQLNRPGPAAELVYVPARQAVARSDESGVFQLPAVPDSQEWNFNVEHSRHRRVLGRIAAGQVDLVVRMERGLELRGIVLGPEAQPLQSVSVALIGGERPYSALSNRTGEFVLGGLDESAGRYLYLKHGEHAPVLLGPVDLANGLGVEVRLGAVARLGGTLTDAQGRPLGGARMTLRYEGMPDGLAPEHYPPELLRLQSGLSSASGGFEFSGIPAGAYSVEVTAEDGRRQSFSGVRTGTADLKLVLTAGQ